MVGEILLVLGDGDGLDSLGGFSFASVCVLQHIYLFSLATNAINSSYPLSIAFVKL